MRCRGGFIISLFLFMPYVFTTVTAWFLSHMSHILPNATISTSQFNMEKLFDCLICLFNHFPFSKKWTIVVQLRDILHSVYHPLIDLYDCNVELCAENFYKTGFHPFSKIILSVLCLGNLKDIKGEIGHHNLLQVIITRSSRDQRSTDIQLFILNQQTI